jgi:P-type Ca2+ transporter type 2C
MAIPKEEKFQTPQQDLKISWHALHSGEVLEKLETKQQNGLLNSEVKQRQEKYGPNQLLEKPRPGFFAMLLEQFKDFIVMMLIIAAVISALLGDYVEAAAIMTIVMLNAILGVVQESRAEEALAALKKMAAPEAQVLRDGERVMVPAHELVPGDIVFLEAGNFIPADLRLLEAVNLKIDEAALTGESVPVQKNAEIINDQDASLGDRKNSAFMGTVVSYGRGTGVVVSTGMLTQLGMIAGMLQSVDEGDTPLQQRLDQLGRTLGYACLGVCGLVFAVGILENLGHIDATVIKDFFMVAVSLAIAAVPEGLPAVVTISLALGMGEMVKRHALIRRLASVETLGSATVICSDKTGTLTQNKMTVTRLWADGEMLEITGNGYEPKGEFQLQKKNVDINQYPAAKDTLWASALNNDSELVQKTDEDGNLVFQLIGDPTEGALLVAAAKAGAVQEKLNSHYPRTHEIPFDSSRKRMVTVHAIEQPQEDDKTVLADKSGKKWYAIAVKGAPDVVLTLCKQYENNRNELLPLTDDIKKKILAANDSMTGDALRVLGFAYRLISVHPSEVDNDALENDLIFTGLMGMIDPARDEVRPALEEARGAGIRTIMITGDYPKTAKAIAEDIHLLVEGHQVMTGAELNDLDDAGLAEAVKRTDVFARVSPEHKMRIVSALRSNGEVVAMTGDGVNDAPAIKLADIGVAMGITGTDVAKGTADMVLTDDNYASIVSAIAQGRIIYSNIRKFVYYLLSCNMAEIMIIFLSMLITGQSPLTAIQLLWLNLVTDGAPALALATEKGDPDIMQQQPRPTKEPIINRFMTIGISVQTVAKTAATLAAFFIGLYASPEHYEFAETMAFVTLSGAELLRAYTSRSEYYPIWKTGLFGNKWMNWAVGVSFALVFVVIYVPFFNPIFNTLPLTWSQWVIVLPLMLIPPIAAELTKVIFAKDAYKKA